MAATRYEADVVAWANEQAAMLRAGDFSALDIEHIADEVEDVGKSEQRELETRMAFLLAHLLKWKYQPARRGARWEVPIREQRKAVDRLIKKTPSLKAEFTDPEWREAVWSEALLDAAKETDLQTFPDICPWSFEQIMDAGFWPH